MSEWTIDSNEAFKITTVRSENDQQEFNPAFTYPIYGTDEKIYGYQDLVIDYRLASGSLRSYLNVSYSAKLPPPSPVDDVKATLEGFIPTDFETDLPTFMRKVEEDAASFKPFGEKIHEYTKRLPSADGKETEEAQFEVWHSTFDTPGFSEYHKRMQLFILLYIEGGSYIDEDNAWEFVCLYEKRRRHIASSDQPSTSESPSEEYTYHFIGYSSLYPFYCFPEKVRMRLSQFVILPPWQSKGHGSALYQAIYALTLARPTIAELTVEDPAEAFEDLRDRNDLRMLVAHKEFCAEAFGEGGLGGGVGPVRHGKSKGKARAKAGKMGPPVDKAWMERWRVQLKIAGRQFSRLVEMLQLLMVDESDPRALRAYRLQVKERLYRFNFEVLMQLEKEERQQKLEETFQSVCDDYRRILAMAKI